MRKMFLIFCLVSLSLAASDKTSPDISIAPEVRQAFASANVPLLRKTQPVADFTVPLADGGTRHIQELSGKVLFLNFWASWCGPCAYEMPSMERLYQKFKTQGLEMLAINYKDEPEVVRAFMAKHKLSFPAGLDLSGRITTRLYGVSAFPTTYIIDRQGRIITRVIGSIEWDTPEIMAALDALLKQK
ncbi:disulfide reductase TlpA-like family [Candidatus Termititenax aidoneus]|uniref:Disulfide reductase TlpA-like family n=1 Tax=Termititenax aidoneus TaxID=2218524 RepID=A0A388TEP3_TERA1|nr:disulfide reductase TlpA-like family [Candidatus Termititenax aidoneus]